MPPTSTVLFSGVGLTIRSGPDGINMSSGSEARERSADSVSSDVGPPGEESTGGVDDYDDARSSTPVKDDTGERTSWFGEVGPVVGSTRL